ncbi:DNA methyltransferase [Roseivivax sp. THAF197b]|uniref:DNA methyltransferase n=1 Tax=Roseivivax sp. THAF197b TaxID=2588299 RepID=UPI00126985DF|nr:DNA methyltransferase [Roseivivax sp. THAF197b]
MSRLTDLIAQAKAKDADLGRELEREFKAYTNRRAFGLNFERHRPESVELPGRPIRKGDKVRILPPRGETKKGDLRLWKVRSLSGKGAERVAQVELIGGVEPETQEVAVADLIVVAEFRDYIYPGLVSTGKVERGSTDWRRETRPNGFYPLHISLTDGKLVSVGEPLPLETERQSYQAPEGTFAVWPLDPSGEDSRWQISPERLRKQLDDGTAALKDADPKTGSASVIYLKSGDIRRVESGELKVVGRSDDGRIITEAGERAARKAKTMWTVGAHDASAHGTALLSRFVPTRKFPFPKSLYAVEDAIRFFVSRKPDATILDFFSGSGTTAHAVMRLNRQDGGNRQCISVTNNEVAAEEQAKLRKDGLRPGDPDWEQWGICDYITKPRIKAAITGKTPDGEFIQGDYKFTDEFPMAEGFEENAEFFTLTYETPVAVSHNRAFARIAPLLWMRAGSEGRRIDKEPTEGWEVADTYGLLTNLDRAASFCTEIAVKGGIRIAYVVTDDERRFQAVTRELPAGVEPVRLYESYLTNFRFAMGR